MKEENFDNDENFFNVQFDKYDETRYDSDVNSNDIYDDDDFFNENNLDYVNASSYPKMKVPSNDIMSKNEYTGKRNYDSSNTVQIYKFHIQKFDTLENLEINSEFENNLNVDDIMNNFQVSFNLKYDITLSKEKLFKLLNDIEWDYEYKIETAKKLANPYEEIFEGFFHRNSSIRISNLNNLFSYNLFVQDYYLETTPVMIVGDDGGLTDYILWHSGNEGITTNLFVIEDKSGKYAKTKFRKELENKREEAVVKYDIFNNQLDIDEDERFNLEKIEEISQDVLLKTSNLGISFYIARKKLQIKSEYFSEMKYKKFLLLNLILSFSTLSKGGNLVIKIYDMFTSFTVSILYIIFNYFESFSIVKPYSLRPHSSSRYVVCQRFTEFQPKIIQYLKDLYEQYCTLLLQGKDIEFIYPISKVIKDEAFKNYIMEINTQIIEIRIEALEELKFLIDNPNQKSKFDKLDIKKRCLTLWKIPILNFGPSISEINSFKRGHNKNDRNKVPSLHELARVYTDIDTYESNIELMIEKMSKNAPKGQLNQNYKKSNYYYKQIEEKKDQQKEKIDNIVTSNRKNGNSKKPNAIQILKEQIISDRKSKEYLNNHHLNVVDDNKKKEVITNKQPSTAPKKNSEKAPKAIDSKVLNKKRKSEEPIDQKLNKKEPSIKIKIPLIEEDVLINANVTSELDMTNEDNKKLPEAKRIEIMEMKLKQAVEENKRLSMQKMNVNDLLQDLNKFKKKN